MKRFVKCSFELLTQIFISAAVEPCNIHMEELTMENYQSNIDETMQYDLSAVEMLRILGYTQSTSGEWFEKLKRDNHINIPKIYMEFMELMADRPLLETSNLWVGKMEHNSAVPRIPHTYYDELSEMIDDRKDCWSKHPSKHERTLYELSQLPVEQWHGKIVNYFVIGSDYANGMGEFGIRMEDMEVDDPPVYWRKNGDDFSIWKLENETLSDFLLNVLIEALACVDYQTAEYELETRGWRCQEYYDLKKDDWVASKSVLKRYGIDYSTVKKYKANSGKVFCCYDCAKNAFFVGATGAGELSLTAINRNEAEHIFLDTDSLEFLIEEVRLFIKSKDKSERDDLTKYMLYTREPKTEMCLSDHCFMYTPLQPEEDGGLLFLPYGDRKPVFSLCSGTALVEVLSKALKKNPKSTNEELMIAFNLYLQTGNY